VFFARFIASYLFPINTQSYDYDDWDDTQQNRVSIAWDDSEEIAQSVPEPSTFLAGVLGLGTMVAARRRR
jgi:hypothetical protein